jgi:hypothetical protein
MAIERSSSPRNDLRVRIDDRTHRRQHLNGDFDWTSHPESYGFTVGMNFDWSPDRAELIDQIHSFLAEIDPETGYLPD